jgi:transposase
MPAPIPALGYRSRTEAAKALAAEGLSDPEIASQLGISLKNVDNLLRPSRGGPGRRPRPAERGGRTVVFPLDTLERLGPHAQRRGISANELARRIVESALDAGLVDAIMDDRDQTA